VLAHGFDGEMIAVRRGRATAPGEGEMKAGGQRRSRSSVLGYGGGAEGNRGPAKLARGLRAWCGAVDLSPTAESGALHR